MSDPSSPFRLGRSARVSGGPRVREVKAWVQKAARAPEEATIMVSELACAEPGCPPFEVVMAVLLPGEAPRQMKLHRRLAELTEDDVQRLWQGGRDGHHDHEKE